MCENYTLDENNEVISCSRKEWGELFMTKDGNDRRKVDFDIIDKYEISTVFLGIDHGFVGYEEKPVVFETMVFGKGENDYYVTRCATWDEAVKMHQKAIQWVNDGCKDE